MLLELYTQREGANTAGQQTRWLADGGFEPLLGGTASQLASCPAAWYAESMLSTLFTGPMHTKLVCASSAAMYSEAKARPRLRTSFSSQPPCASRSLPQSHVLLLSAPSQAQHTSPDWGKRTREELSTLTHDDFEESLAELRQAPPSSADDDAFRGGLPIAAAAM